MLGKLAVADICIAKHAWVPSNHEAADELHKRNESFMRKILKFWRRAKMNLIWNK